MFLSIVCVLYIYLSISMPFLSARETGCPADLAVSIIGTLLVLEACRRVIGLFMTGICIVGMIYAFIRSVHARTDHPQGLQHRADCHHPVADHRGHLWPAHRGGRHLCLCIRAFRGRAGIQPEAATFFIDLAYALTGRFSGGPAKTVRGGFGFHGLGFRFRRRQCGGHRFLHHPHDEARRLPTPCGRCD